MKSILPYSITFLIIAIIAAIFGFSEISGSRDWILQILFGVFLCISFLAFVTDHRVK